MAISQKIYSATTGYLSLLGWLLLWVVVRLILHWYLLVNWGHCAHCVCHQTMFRCCDLWVIRYNMTDTTPKKNLLWFLSWEIPAQTFCWHHHIPRFHSHELNPFVFFNCWILFYFRKYDPQHTQRFDYESCLREYLVQG